MSAGFGPAQVLVHPDMNDLDFLDWRQQSRTFTQMAAIHNKGFNLSGVAQPENIGGYAVSPNFLSLLGVQPILGRDLLPSEEKQGTNPVVLLSYQLWQSHLGGDPGVLGRSISLEEPDGDDTQAAAEGDQRRLGSEHHAQAQGRERGQHDPGQLDGLGRPLAHLESVGR